MSDSSCFMNSLSYASPIWNETEGQWHQGNPMHSSVSFGRFMTESLSWEKWSTFSHNRYVEEAASYAQPGSVAQKKAFFEAHYRRIAARNAAALLEANDDVDSHNNKSPETSEDDNILDTQTTKNEEQHEESEVAEHKENKAPTEDGLTKSSHKTKHMKKPLFMSSFSSNQQVLSKKRLSFSSTKLVMNLKKASQVEHFPSKHVNLKKGLNKNVTNDREGESLGNLLAFGSTKEVVIPPASAMQKTKACPTPLRTPIYQATKIGISKMTPCSENRSNSTLVDPSVPGSKTTVKNWHILSAVSRSMIACKNKLQSPTMSTPFLLRTEQRATRRKQKLEEKFNSKADEKVQLQTKLKDKADNEIKKICQSFCFKARPRPDFYEENGTIRTQTDQVSRVGKKL